MASINNKTSINEWQGKKIRIRAIEPADARLFFEWNQDSEMPRHVDRLWPPTSMVMVEAWAEKTAKSTDETDEFFFVIENHEGALVGQINPTQCDRRVGTFSYGVSIRRPYQRQGYAREAIRMILRYFFDELRYQKATVHIHSYNEVSVRLHENIGFQKEGQIRRTVYTEGQHFDTLVYGLTVEEFRASVESG